ncbi:hypothetical protein FTO74_06310 [Granulicella sp. WH15]|uniref:TonB-dependent receptor n=1 Tax=Granulicella sp. WH15 TaxID=2602070 RepID=UPI0013678C96|nr:TonB-dependent receptor [Granulicella sp. WH15]QHN03026.1 hypothetical protein FTO74_06310 [Granulicella sp. WH15]
MRKILTLVLCSVLALFAAAANAQQTLGSINGTVLDASGAAVPDSTVTITDADINVTRTTRAQSNGFFQVFNLPVGTYKVQVSHDGFDTTQLVGIGVQEASAATVKVTLKVGEVSTTVEVTGSPLLNATDTTNGYTMDQTQIASTPLATGSFTQLAVLAPGASAELLAGVDTNAGLGNQAIWANGQRDTSNTFQLNGVDITNLFNGKTTSGVESQRVQFNIGQSSAIGGESQTGTSVYGSNGNSLPTPPPEFLQELRVNTSMYDAQQGATSGAQIDANISTGTNHFHGQVYGSIANNALNASPFFFKQQAELAQIGVGAFPQSLANPALHRWTTGGTLGGPIIKDKLFFFIAYQHLYSSDESTGLSQFNVPSNLTDDRSDAALTALITPWNHNKPLSGFALDPTGIAQSLFRAKLNGQYIIPSAQNNAPYEFGVPNVTLIGVSSLVGDQATVAIDYNASKSDRLSFKYFYQNDPSTKPYGFSSQVAGFPSNSYNGSQVGVIDNTITIGSHLNWEQRLGYARMGSYTSYNQTVTNGGDPTFGIANSAPGAAALLPSLSISEFATGSSGTPSLRIGPNSTFVNTGYFQNRLNPSTNVIFQLGKHAITAGGGYSYTQLNIENNRNALLSATSTSLATFLEGQVRSSSVLETLQNGKNLANRYYRSNEAAAYVQDKWQALSNLSITFGVRYDYHGGMTEKYGNFFNFDPNAYDVTGTDPAVGGSGFTVNNDGLVVAGNNPTAPTAGTSASTLTGRQWGFAPRVGFAWSPKRDNGTFVIRGGVGMYYDRGELFTYLSPPAGGSVGGPFGVTQQSPLVAAVSGNGKTLQNPLGTAGALTSTTTPPAPGVNPAIQKTALQNQLNYMTSSGSFGLNCGAVGNLEDDCTQTPLYLGAYDKNNVLPYTINYTLSIQWQPRNDIAVTIGYTGNRGRHAVIPIPFNEPQQATASNPAMILGKTSHSSGENTTYGYSVLNGDTSCGKYDDPCPIKSEPWSTYDGGNSDFRVPYVGYSPYSALFETVGNSAYDALETHLEKRMSHHVAFGASYTWGHALDEQSDIGLFFTGNDPAHLKNSYASADFDRTHIFAANFQVLIPNAAPKHSLISYLTNDWGLTGIGILQSGQPYSLYEFNGAVASAQLGYFPSLINPVLPIANPKQPNSALTGNSGRLRGVGGSYMPAIDPNQIALQYLQPGQKGVPTAAQGNPNDPVDVYETDFSPVNQRNIFRQAAQKRLDISLRKDFRVTDRFTLRYGFNAFNLTNTTSMDIPQNGPQIAQHGSCATSFATTDDCESNYEKFGMIYTNRADQASAVQGAGAPAGGGSAGSNLYQRPYTNGTSGKSTIIPTTLPLGVNGCTAATSVTSTTCANNGANFGSVTGAIGSSRIITMDLHVVF